jgi:uncharacterized protein YbjT (DUF2867 family)
VILIAGGSGTLGRAVVARLVASGQEVRVLTRDSSHVEGLGVGSVIGDVRDPSTLSAATEGASVVISAVHGFVGGRGAGPEEVDLGGNRNLVRACVGARVDHFIMLSALGAAADHPMSLHRAKYAAEQDLRASGLSWTILRPSSYVETWTGIVGGKVASGGPGLVFGRGDNLINFISVQDVATLVELAVSDAALRGQTIDVPGLDNLTMVELAQRLGASKVRHVPRGALRLLAGVLPALAPAFARQAQAAVVMDTTVMSADAAALVARFPDIVWHPAAEVAGELGAINQGHGRGRQST